MGFKKHGTLKCHTCTRKQALGGVKNSGSYRHDMGGWKMVELKSGSYVNLCPNCVKRTEKEAGKPQRP
jgi:hypothetical protein